MKIIRRNEKPQHTKNIKEKRREKYEILSMLCNRAGAIFFVTLDGGQGSRVSMIMDSIEAFLDMGVRDV